MNTMDRAPHFTFHSKTEANQFCKRLRESVLKYDVIVMNDILRDRRLPLVANGYRYGYNRKAIKSLKPEKIGNSWQVAMPMPGKMIRDGNGFWTTKTEEGDHLGEHGS